FIKMRKESADRHVINAFPLTRTDVIGKILQIAGIRLDGMRRSIALPQHAQELVRGLLDGGTLLIGSLAHFVKNLFTTESQRHGGRPILFIRLSNFLCVANLVSLRGHSASLGCCFLCASVPLW